MITEHDAKFNYHFANLQLNNIDVSIKKAKSVTELHLNQKHFNEIYHIHKQKIPEYSYTTPEEILVFNAPPLICTQNKSNYSYTPPYVI
jgi:hypothetical protein